MSVAVMIQCPSCSSGVWLQEQDVLAIIAAARDEEEAPPLPPAPVADAVNEHQEHTRQGRECPVHHTARRSNFGGLFCPQPYQDSETGWCPWKTSPGKERGAA